MASLIDLIHFCGVEKIFLIHLVVSFHENPANPKDLFPLRNAKSRSIIARHHSIVEETFDEQNSRVLSEMRILAKIRVAILDFVGYVESFVKFGAKLDFRV